MLCPKREKAQHHYQDAIEKLKHNELQQQEAAETQKNIEEDLRLHKVTLVKVKLQPCRILYLVRLILKGDRGGVAGLVNEALGEGVVSHLLNERATMCD